MFYFSELLEVSDLWTRLSKDFPSLAKEIPNFTDIGPSLVAHAEFLDHFVQERCFTQIHGDCKAWNIFVGKTSNDMSFIDMAWTGKGHPFQDVAYLLTTSLQAELLPQMQHFVQYYINQLKSHVEESKIPLDFHDHFDLVWLDYARVIVTGLWKNLSPERMKKYENLIGPSMITKSLPHIKFIIMNIRKKLIEEKVIDKARNDLNSNSYQ